MTAPQPSPWSDAGQRGPVLLIAAWADSDRCTPDQATRRRLRQRFQAAGIATTELFGPPEPDLDLTAIDPDSRHEQAWIRAGVLFERLRCANFAEPPAQVCYLDPWVVCLDALMEERFPTTVRWCVLQDEHEEGEAASFLNDTRSWVERRGISSLSTDPELIGGPADRADQPTLLRGKWPNPDMVLVDGLPENDPEGFLRQILNHHDGRPVVVLTAEQSSQSDRFANEAMRCAMVLPTEELTTGCHAALLSQAAVYIAPHGPATGIRALENLPAACVLHVPESFAARLPASRRPHTHVLRFANESVDASHPPSPENARADDKSRAAGISGDDGQQQWWQALAPLIEAKNPPPSTIATTATHTTHTTPVRRTEKRPAAAATIALLTCCHKYLQRFRVFIDSVLRQDHPLESIEVCVAVPGNPDGILEYIDLVRHVHPRLRLTAVEVPEHSRSHKGKLMNAAFAASAAPIVMATDCDLVLPSDFVTAMTRDFRPDRVRGCWRTPLSPETTARILIGAIDPVARFAELAHQWDADEYKGGGGVRQGLLGYCQIVAREAFAEVGYPEEFAGYGQSDAVFVDRLLERLGIRGDFRKDRHVLHLSHLRDWSGTKVFL